MGAIALPRPSNLRSDGTLVEADVYHICERVKELSPDLYIYAMEPGGFAICEQCTDGVERLVMRTPELDGRVIERLQYMLNVPFEHRLAEAEKKAEKFEAEHHEEELEELYEKLGGPMLPALERTGFIQRSKSYPKSRRRGRGRL